MVAALLIKQIKKREAYLASLFLWRADYKMCMDF